jgi:hypothetical protein
MQNSFRLNIHFLVMKLYLFSAIHIYVHLLYDWSHSCESLIVFSTSGNTQLMESLQDDYFSNYLCKWVSSIDQYIRHLLATKVGT